MTLTEVYLINNLALVRVYVRTLLFNVCARGRPGVSAYQLNEKQPTWASILDAEYWAYNIELHIGIAYTVKLNLC